MDAVESQVGEQPVVAERYRLIKKLGEGAMGAVFLAEHVHMRKRFALKLLLPTAMGSPEIVARFEREAIAAGNIDHPGVCAATDFGRLPDGSFFLVLEYVDGQSLRTIVHDGPMVPDRAIVLVRQILAALAAAHAKGVVHRDIKPEQAMGKAVDHRVDLYAVGVMLHEMITGKPPFEGDGIVILARHVNDPIPPLVSPLDPRGVTPDLSAYVERLLAKKADDRPESAQQAIAELDLARSSLAAFPVSTLPTGLHRGAASDVAEARTMVGEPSPTPPPVVAAPSPPGIEGRLSPLAQRLGVRSRTLLVALAGAAALFVVVLMIVMLRPSSTAEDDEPERRPRKRPVAAAPAKSAKDDTPPEPSAEKASAAPSTSSSSGKASGGIKGLGRKIKSLF